MLKTLFAAAAAFALFAAQPVLAGGGCEDCKNCPHKMAASDKQDGEKKPVACPCVGEGKECKCGAACQCPHCVEKKAAEGKKT